jgi:hypothetical protein
MRWRPKAEVFVTMMGARSIAVTTHTAAKSGVFQLISGRLFPLQTSSFYFATSGAATVI